MRTLDNNNFQNVLLHYNAVYIHPLCYEHVNSTFLSSYYICVFVVVTDIALSKCTYLERIYKDTKNKQGKLYIMLNAYM